jgi:1-acyl-sn-glycerol-3-phosphate acyltransferase
MEQWHYDPAADFDQERACEAARAPGVLVSGVRSLAAAVVRCWLRGYHRLTIVGRENLPSGRSFVLIANHASHVDTLCLLSALPLRQLHRAFTAAAQDYFFSSGSRGLLSLFFNALPFDRTVNPRHSLSLCAGLLQKPGNVLIFFPEGTRSETSEPGEFKPGVGLLVAGKDIPVVPCNLSGTHAAWPKGAWFPRPKAIRLTIGAPRDYTHLPHTKESFVQIGRELREAVMLLGRGEPGPARANPVQSAAYSSSRLVAVREERVFPNREVP